MPNRIIKESICTSEDINALSDKEEIFFYRLIVNCDDYGIMDARHAILRSKCFPLKLDKVKDDDIEKWLKSLVGQGLIFLYEVDGRQYLKMTKWERHQQVRAKRSKYPKPDGEGVNLISDDIICNQEQEDDDICPRESESESLSKSNNIYSPVISYLNQKSGTNYKHTSRKTQDLIKARVNEKFTLEDFKTVIDKKAAEWKGTDMEKYLRPETLFGTKFEGYLNQKESKPKLQQQKPTNAANFDQRQYDDTYYDKFFSNTGVAE